MRLRSLLHGLFARFIQGKGHGVGELARRLGMSEEELRAVEPAYRKFSIAKRGGGWRKILAPDDQLKIIQRRILRRLLGRLKCHPAATGFERGQSIVTNARSHVGKAVVVRLDLKDFFTSTRAKRVHAYFRRIGWNRDASRLYVSNRLAGTITIIDVASRQVAATWTVGGSPDMMQVSPDGLELWTSNRFGHTVSVIETTTGRVLDRIEVGESPHGLTYFPQPGLISLGHNGVYR